MYCSCAYIDCTVTVPVLVLLEDAVPLKSLLVPVAVGKAAHRTGGCMFLCLGILPVFGLLISTVL
jgi:hypothetical protein